MFKLNTSSSNILFWWRAQLINQASQNYLLIIISAFTENYPIDKQPDLKI